MNSPRRYFSLNDLDRKLEKYVDFDGGIIFEAGANDGVDQSNSLYFELFRGWRSILVEPIPPRYRQCTINRPSAIVECGALVPPDRENELIELVYCNLMTVTRNTPETRGWEDDHVSRGVQFLGGGEPIEFQSRGLTISSILDKHRIDHVDVLSLDVEGFEIPALAGIDFARHRPSWLLIEVRDDRLMDAYLSSYYDRVENLSHHDVLYKRRS
jgi:FkbM family methyltransferase